MTRGGAAIVVTNGGALEDSQTQTYLDPDADQIVAKLREISRRVALEYTLNVGRVVIHQIYGGDLNEWRSRGPKSASFRRLAAHPDLPMSPSALYRCVAIFAMCHQLGGLERWPRLGVGHLRCALVLPDAKRADLLQQANAKRWSVRQFESACRAWRQQADPGRSRQSQQKHCVSRLKALARSMPHVEAMLLEGATESFPSEELTRALDQLTATREWVARLRAILSRAEKRKGASESTEASECSSDSAPILGAGCD